MKEILSPAYSLKVQNIILFLNRGLIFFQMVKLATLLRRWPTLWKSTLKITTLFRRFLTLFNSTLKNTTLFQRFFFDVHNVVSMLIWRCATSRRHINLKKRWTDVEMFDGMTCLHSCNKYCNKCVTDLL